jgi:hypothetical protein
VDWAGLVGRLNTACVEHLGQAVQYRTGAGQVVTIDDVIFDDGHVRIDATPAGVTSTGPWVFVKLADLPTDPEEDDPDVMVNGTTYRVFEVQRDGQGGAKLMLKKVA